MKKALILVIAALALPSVALAGAPAVPGKSAPKVAYILQGKILAYTPYNSVGPVVGSVQIMVGHSNYHGKALHGMTLTFPVDAKTRVVLHNGKPIAANDRGIVKIRALKRIAPADLANTLQLSPAKQIIDMGAPKS